MNTEDRAMSKEREDFVEWYGSNPEQDENGNYVGAFTQARWETWQAATSHYQPLLDAKDAEIAWLNSVVRVNHSLHKSATEENTTLKAEIADLKDELTGAKFLRDVSNTLLAEKEALLEQARERVGNLRKSINNDRFDYRYERGYNQALEDAVTAINAATGEK